MPFPAGLPLVEVTCGFDALPDGAASGRIRFETTLPLVGPVDNSIVPPITAVADLDADTGAVVIELPATNHPNWTPVDQPYLVTCSVQGAVFRGTLLLDYQVLEVNLADLLQVDGTAEPGVTYATLAQLNAGLDEKADLDHEHVIGDVADLQTQLDGKLDVPPEPYITAADVDHLASQEMVTEGLAEKSYIPVETVFAVAGAASYSDPGPDCKYLDVTIVAGGGGGGSGRRGAATSVRSGGGGGGGGGLSRALIPYAGVSFPVTIAVGAAGAGAAAIAVNDTNGGAGTAGGASSFGTYLRATGGGGGAGGSTGAGTGGFSGGGTTFGQTGASSSASGALPGNPSAFASGPTAGGAGGGITTGDAPSNGGAGGAGMNSTAGTAGVVGGAAAGAGPSQPVSSGLPGNGGGGGAASILAAAGAGGAAGSYGAGGGGGGGSLNGNASGAGGNGGAGIVRVVAFF